MYNRTVFPFFLISILAVAWLLSRQETDRYALVAALPPLPRLDSTHQALVDQYENFLLDARSREPTPALAVAIVKNNRVIYERVWGVLSVENEVPANAKSVFRLASLSKGFAPVLSGIFVEKGLLNWDDPVFKYLPELQLHSREYTRSLKLEHVLSHTTGLPRHTYSNLLNMAVPYEDILRQLREVPPAHPVGSHYNYQNVAYSFIGDALEKVGGKSYEALLKEYVLQAANMTEASVGYEAIVQLNNVALPHSPDAQGYHRKQLEPDWYSVAPAAGVNASIRDMSKWLQLLMGQRPDIIADSTLEKIFTPYVPVSRWEKNLRSWRSGLDQSFYGFGWRIMDYKGRRIIYHGGYVNGYRTEISFDREQQIGLVLLSSSSNYFASESMPVFWDLYNRSQGEELTQKE